MSRLVWTQSRLTTGSTPEVLILIGGGPLTSPPVGLTRKPKSIIISFLYLRVSLFSNPGKRKKLSLVQVGTKRGLIFPENHQLSRLILQIKRAKRKKPKGQVRSGQVTGFGAC